MQIDPYKARIATVAFSIFYAASGLAQILSVFTNSYDESSLATGYYWLAGVAKIALGCYGCHSVLHSKANSLKIYAKTLLVFLIIEVVASVILRPPVRNLLDGEKPFVDEKNMFFLISSIAIYCIIFGFFIQLTFTTANSIGRVNYVPLILDSL